jgi:flagellar motor switch protein FliN/FliY
MTTELNQQDTTGISAAAAAVITAATSGLSNAIGVPVTLQPTAVAVDEIPSPGVEDVWVEIPLTGAVSGTARLIIDGGDVGSIVAAVKPDHSVDAPIDEGALVAFAGAMAHFAAGFAAALSVGLGAPVEAGQPVASLQRAQDFAAGTVAVAYTGEIADADDVEVFWLIEPPVATAIRESWEASTTAEPKAAETPATCPSPSTAARPVATTARSGGGVIDTVELDIAVELGNVAMTIGELLHMGEGSVVTLTQAVGDKVILLANGTAVASGEVVVVDGTLGFRVADLITEASGA